MEEICLLELLKNNDENDMEMQESFQFMQQALVVDLHFTEYLQSSRISIDSFEDDVFVSNFRFEKEEFSHLLTILAFPEKLSLSNRSSITNDECLLILLARSSYPARLVTLRQLLKKSETIISRTVDFSVKWILNRFSILMSRAYPSNLRQKLSLFASVLSEKNCPMDNIVGFIDGTARRICRPSKLQKPFYSGHKGFHCIKFQCIMYPNGIIGQCHGAYNGSRHDSGILHESKLIDEMQDNFIDNTGKRYALFGDPGYPQSAYIITPYGRNNGLSRQQEVFNKRLSHVREAVEWGFGKVVALWAFVDFHKNQKVLLQPVSNYYKLAVLLTNFHTCYYGSQVCDYFQLEPPDIKEYITTG